MFKIFYKQLYFVVVAAFFSATSAYATETVQVPDNKKAYELTQEEVNHLKNQYKYDFVTGKPYVPIVFLGERYESDALLELAKNGYRINNKLHKLTKSAEIILMMPRIDLLGKYMGALAKTTNNLYVFIMDNDKQAEPYGDRSYQQYLKQGLDKRLPKNVIVFRLQDESVTPFPGKNNFEFSRNASILDSAVFNNQVKQIFQSITKVKNNYPQK
ncbi:hypothetical protein ACIWO4_05360 [Avibacterium paragallinarum]|uniref:hypothetical protein n=1 Tax=Avibacterium paragallinarum TaxID=728 RepID=UPI00398826EA